MKSIMQDKQEGYCYLCATLHMDYERKNNLEEHHVFHGTANRKLAERYGLKVYLCPEHHRTSLEAVHRNSIIDERLKMAGQRAFERDWCNNHPEGDPREKFREIFGKSYL